METTQEQGATRSRQLIPLIDELFEVFEEVHGLLGQWKPSYHLPFIIQLKRLQEIESEVMALGFDDEFIRSVEQIVYHSVFGKELKQGGDLM